jgi:predicted nuclease of predicted toxin-antitoxin system
VNAARRVLLDECVPRTLRHELPEWAVDTVREIGWASKLDGELLRAADEEYDVLITVDRRLVYQQNLTGLRLAIVVLLSYRNSFRALQPLVPELKEVLGSVRPGEIVFLPR